MGEKLEDFSLHLALLSAGKVRGSSDLQEKQTARKSWSKYKANQSMV